jgi:hypothetical protein
MAANHSTPSDCSPDCGSDIKGLPFGIQAFDEMRCFDVIAGSDPSTSAYEETLLRAVGTAAVADFYDRAIKVG